MNAPNSDISINPISKRQLLEFTKFVAREYYNHNFQNEQNTELIQREIDSMYDEDVKQFPYSLYYAAKSHNKIIGTIKVTQWNGKDTLPIQKLFDINVKKEKVFGKGSVWHVGRFATSSISTQQDIFLFKKLMVYAIRPICNDISGVMFAECDTKLLRVMTFLGIKTTILGKAIEYLHSETLPIYITSQGLMPFLSKNIHLVKPEIDIVSNSPYKSAA